MFAFHFTSSEPSYTYHTLPLPNHMFENWVKLCRLLLLLFLFLTQLFSNIYRG